MNTTLFHWNTIVVLGFFTPTTPSTKPSFKASSNDEQQQQQQAAVSVSTIFKNKNKNKNKLDFHTSQNPDSVLALLRNHGFSQTQISKLVKMRPTLLNSDPEQNLLPKIQFFSSIGISGADLARIFSSNPIVLRSSLEKQLLPCYNFLKTEAHLNDRQVIKAFKCGSWLFRSSALSTFTPNVALLRQLEVPQSSISLLFSNFPQVPALRHTRFVQAVEETRKMGFDPSKVSFVLAIRMLSAMTTSKWESKFEVFGKWGLSKEDTLDAFTKFPLVMMTSDKKIEETMDFLVNKMGWPWASKQIAKKPGTLCYSFQKNIVPKCYVFRVLQLKGLIKQEFPLTAILSEGEKYFLDRYVTKFEESVPELLYLYEGDVDLLEFI